jgi:hypothetical protein
MSSGWETPFVAVPGEHYSYLQSNLRAFLADHPRHHPRWRLGTKPPADAETYGKGIYQESIAVLAWQLGKNCRNCPTD